MHIPSFVNYGKPPTEIKWRTYKSQGGRKVTENVFPTSQKAHYSLCIYSVTNVHFIPINCVTENSSHHLIVNQLRQTGYHNNRDYSAFNILTCIRLHL
jgi:hypothetical protein